MAFILQTDNFRVGVFLHEPCEQCRTVFAVAIRITEDFFRIKIFLISELFLVSLVIEASLHEMQKHADKLCRSVLRFHLVESRLEHLLCLDRHRRHEINREHRHRDIVEIRYMSFVVWQRDLLVFRESQCSLNIAATHIENAGEVERHLFLLCILFAEIIRIHRFFGFSAAVDSIIFHFALA